MRDEIVAVAAALTVGIFVTVFVMLASTLAIGFSWNAFAPELLGLPKASAWNAFGIVVLMLTAKVFFSDLRVEKK